MATLKILLLAVIFVITSGSVFSSYFRKHKLVTVLAALVAIISSYYLMRSIYEDIIKNTILAAAEAIAESETKNAEDVPNSAQVVDLDKSTLEASSAPGSDEAKLTLTESIDMIDVDKEPRTESSWLTSKLYGSDNRVAAL